MAREIYIVGQSCRLPGAPNVEALRALLHQGRCSVSAIPHDRWNSELVLHPTPGTQAKAYTMAAGVLDDIWGFDLSVFNLSPREVRQMDPQQRLLLQVVWEALEDARIDPARLAGKRVGVYVGSSGMDHAALLGRDPSLVDAYMMTGNTLSLVANRISHAFDLRGPSFLVDTACSSALVALDLARQALARGDIDTAIVGGVNLLISPLNYIGFSAARMLSPTGLCQAFSDTADGYVRAEGSVALVLQASEAAPGHARAILVDSETNSDGFTMNVAMPSAEGQFALLRRLYDRAGVAADELSFVEAHGTGTLVGDPIEAQALGRALGRQRSTPLPIGSVKSNVGHLEPVSGLVGVLKTLIAFQDRRVPASLHAATPNRYIDFEALNLSLLQSPLVLQAEGQVMAGVSSFGFGGVNAHCILATPPQPAQPQPQPQPQLAQPRSASPSGRALPARHNPDTIPERLFVTSAFSDEALRALAADYGARFTAPDSLAPGGLIDQAWAARGLLPKRLAVLACSPEQTAEALAAHAAGLKHPAIVTAESRLRDAPTLFAYSGNGAQYAGMCRLALRHDGAYREMFARIDREFTQAAGWSLEERLHAPSLKTDLAEVTVAQALLFADQAAQTAALRARGLVADAVIGHSGGEIAAAWACGALDLADAVKLVVNRSRVIAPLAGQGGMAALQTSASNAELLLAEFSAACPPDTPRHAIALAAVNSPRSVTLVGPSGTLDSFARWVKRQHRLGCVLLSVNYPYHSVMQDPFEAELISALAGLNPKRAQIPFFSATRGAAVEGVALDSHYWWQNMRQPVRFEEAVKAAFTQGYRAFIEIGPQPVLANYLADSIGDDMASASVTHTLARSDPDTFNPLARATARAVLNGCRLAEGALFAAPSAPRVALPHYPWQNTPLQVTDSPMLRRALGLDAAYHPLLGAQVTTQPAVWSRELDDRMLPTLADHKVGREVLLPATAFAEMAFAAAAHAAGTDTVEIFDLDISAPLVLSVAKGVEMQTVVDVENGQIRIMSRPRLSEDSFRNHMRARFSVLAAPTLPPAVPAPAPITPAEDEGRGVYVMGALSGLRYGPAFQGVTALRCAGDQIELTLREGLGLQAPHPVKGFDPVQVDCLLHGLIAALRNSELEHQGLSLVPVRIGRLQVLRAGAVIAAGRLDIRRWGRQSLLVDVTGFAPDGAVVLRMEGVRLRALQLVAPILFDRHAFHVTAEPCPALSTNVAATVAGGLMPALEQAMPGSDTEDEAALLINAATCQAIWSVFHAVSGRDGSYQCRHIQHPAETLLLRVIEQFGLASPTSEPDRWTITPECTLPASDQVALTLLAEQPGRSAELVVLMQLPEVISQILATPDTTDLPEPAALFGREALRNLDQAHAASARTALTRALDAVSGLDEGRSLRAGALGADEQALEALLASGCATTVARLCIGEKPATTCPPGCRDIGEDAGHGLDLIVVSDAALLMPGDMPERLHRMLAPSAQVVILCRPPALLSVAAHASDAASAKPAISPERIVGLLEALDLQPGLRFSLPEALGGGELFIAQRHAGQAEGTQPAQATQSAPDWCDVWAALHGDCTRAAGLVSLITPDDPAHPLLAVADADAALPDLASAILDLKAHVMRASAGQRALVVMLPGGAQFAGSQPADPLQHALWAMLRTVANEYPALPIRVIDPAPFRAGTTAMAARLRRVLREVPHETELVLTTEGAQALRVVQGVPLGKPQSPAAQTALRLERPASGRLDEMKWHPVARPEPQANMVEIEIAATGLNYRDVMWAMGLLPEEALETGFAGQTLGLECAGRVSRVGAGVEGLAVGDPVLAFGPACFASHLCIDRNWVHKLPDTLPLAQAAALPVAYFTAYYALVTLGQLRAGETVLIHGGAGGVGLAAISVAQDIGATVIATAGSPVKQTLLRKLGVAHVLSSRSTDFAAQIRALTAGKGVDVVLNSLAGAAMEQSLNLLRPFGRFLELGKLDYYANTAIGLRAFKDNIQYFGVDIDSLLAARPDAARHVFTQVMDGLIAGRYAPLPYTAFESPATIEAFRLMQRSGHTGKVVIVPPAPGAADTRLIEKYQAPAFRADPEGWHVIAGGLGGIGFEIAQWLHLQKGASRIALLSRRGQPPSELLGPVARLRAGLRDLRIISCDIAEDESVERALDSLRESAPIASVFHAAMLLEDRTLATLDHESLARTLPVKTRGLANLDRATRQDQLGAFVAITSLAALIGNHGQAAYVAANAFQEAIIQARHQQGLPALALGLGAITDAGYLTRDPSLARMLEQMSGNVPFSVSAVLHALHRLMTLPDCGPCVTITPMRWSSASAALRVLGNPSHQILHQLGEGAGGGQANTNLRDDLLALPYDKAEKRVIAFVKEEMAAILRVSVESLALTRPVSEYGMDSLMGVELGLATQAALGDDLPLLTMSDNLTIERIAQILTQHVHASAQDSSTQMDEVQRTLQTLRPLHEDAGGDRISA